MEAVYLYPGAEKRILRGHRWIFSNEISGKVSEYEPASWVEVFSSKRTPLGIGYINPGSLISVRLVCPPGQTPSREFFRRRILEAERFRTSLIYPGSTCHRVVYGESDGLPGLVVDRYGEILVYQITTLGMASMESMIQELLTEIFKPRAIVFRNDTAARTIEGLPLHKGIAYGTIPQDCTVAIDGITFTIDPLAGQKTGLYLDQRDNRLALRRWTRGKKVLDLFCYSGAWSITAAMNGATEVLGVDDSLEAVDQARRNASLNGVEDRCRFMGKEVFTHLRQIERGAFDVIVVDPPAFAKTKSALHEAVKGYTDLNRRAMLALAPGGILVTCSCSYHVSSEIFRDALLQAAKASGRRLRLLESRGQAMDHPVLLAMPETQYLKCAFLQIP
ncbi:MAG: class I SAM-dependent rRNA methyltransferase [Deltaproteobacteria bacterium]|jgi:23S rRNA (cytosine1962-C5)-methyltransferase|nr:class I SAM-dependent rRNA methyltransferase [Deltaproteobacteria bacterium]